MNVEWTFAAYRASGRMSQGDPRRATMLLLAHVVVSFAEVVDIAKPSFGSSSQWIPSDVAHDATLGVYVVTSEGPEYKARIQQARRTWAPIGSPVLFVSAVKDTHLGVDALPCPDDEEGGVCCKTLLGMQLSLAIFPNAAWIVRVVDDTFVFPKQLVAELGAFDATTRLYVGQPSVTLHCYIAKFAGQCAELHGGGGGGVVLSRTLVEEVLGDRDTFLANCKHDDVFLGHFLRYVLGVHMHMLPGILQEPRFVGSSWNPFRAPPPCPLPLPPPVYARMLDWGPLTPFAPLDVRRLGLVHSEPTLWPLLQALPGWADVASARAGAIAGHHSHTFNSSRGPAKGLLIYADTAGRRIVSPHFRDADWMGVCVYWASDLLTSFADAAKPPPGVPMVM